MAAKKITGTFKKAKETKGTWMFLAEEDTFPVQNIYFTKAGLDKIDNAETLSVSFEVK